MIKKYLPIILRQYNTGIWMGGLKDMFNRAGFYLTIINFGLLVRTTYNTGSFSPWLTFWLFTGFCLLILFFAMIFEWKIGAPSAVRYQNYMRAKHYSPEYEAIKELAKEIINIEKNFNIKEVSNIKKLLKI